MVELAVERKNLAADRSEHLGRERPRGAVAAGADYLEPALELRAPGEIGVIASVTEQFCGSCDRVRLTADGKLRSCLFALDEHDLRPVLRGGGTDDDLAAVLERAVGAKWAGHAIGQVQFIRPSRSMSQIGG